MTEKRFEMIITSADGSFHYLDKITGEKITSTLELENKLNEVNNENEQLKSKLEESKKAHSRCDKLWWELHDEKEQLEKENEQLKPIKKFADRNGICIFNIDEAFRRCWQDNAKLVKENEQLKQTIDGLTLDNTKQKKVLNATKKENKQLKQTIETQNFNYENAKGVIHSSEHQIQQLQDENEQLKQRNNRQYEQLGRLYNLIEQKDWRALNDILDDFKKCDEQLQKEWGTYGDVE